MTYNKEHLPRDNKPTRKQLRDKSITTMLKRKNIDIDDILAQDDVNEVLNTVIKEKANITDMIVLYYDNEDTVHMKSTGPLNSRAVYMLEFGKFHILNDNSENED